ncbi:MAG: tetratricopeptide repeat protein, partial [bacterium]
DYGTFAVAAFLLTTDGIQRRDEQGRYLGEFSANQQMYLLGYGKTLTDYLAVGFSVKLFGHNLGDYSAFGAGSDLGLQLTLTQNLSLGVNLQNLIQPRLTLNQDEEILPRNLKVGVGAQLPISAGKAQLSLAADVDKSEGLDPRFHVGAELALMNSYFLRGGYDREQIAVGAAVRYRWVTLGYAFLTQENFDAQHRLSLDLALGGSVESMLAKRQQEKFRAAQELAADNRERELTFALEQARTHFDAGAFDSAAAYYNTVLAFAENDEARDRLAAISRMEREALSDRVRAGTVAELDSARVEQLLTDLRTSLETGDLTLADWQLSQLRPTLQGTESFNQLEQEFVSQRNGAALAARARGQQLEAQGRWVEAAISYDRATQLNPDDRNAQRSLNRMQSRIRTLELLRDGLAYLGSGDTLAAMTAFDSVLVLVPEDSAAGTMVASIAASGWRQGEAATLDQIRADENSWSLYLKGIEEFRAGRYQEAIALWRQVLESHPGNVETRKNIEQAQLRLQASTATDDQASR